MTSSPGAFLKTGTAAVTGANGYVGSRLRDHLSQQGWTVHSLVRGLGGEAPPTGASIPFTLDDGVDSAKLHGIDVLVHCAYDFRATRWDEIRRTNVEGSRRLFKAASEAGVRRIILISTMSAYEGCASMYGRAKLEIERCAVEHGAAVVRPGLVYGRGAEGMVGALDRFVRVSRVAPVFGGGKQTLFLAHQGDLARLVHVLCCEPEPPQRPVVAACENGITFKEILRTLARSRKRELLFVPAPWRVAWLLLRSAEAVGIRVRLRSDSLVSLLNQNQNPDFGPTRRIGEQFRDFREWTGD
jgi:nucleoside-diphosphate-sugar epimerase